MGYRTQRIECFSASDSLRSVFNARSLSFRARVVPTVVTVALLALLCTLGVWQLGRAEYKADLFAQHAQRSAGPPIDLNDPGDLSGEHRYAPAQASGSFDSLRQFLLDNRTHKGVAGYDVFTPFRVAGTRSVVLVNRGWVTLGKRRDVLPDVRVDEGEMQLSGLLNRPPQGGLLLGAPGYEASGWPLVVQRIDIESVQAKLGSPVLPLVLQMDARLPHGFVREWKPYLGMGPDRHRAYAFQWFALATTLLVIYVVVNTKRRSTPKA